MSLSLAIARNWWVLLLRGVLALALGILAFAWPGMTLFVLVALFGAYMLVDGVAAIALGVGARHEGRNWWEMALVGALGIAAGVVAFFWPGITALALVVIIGVAAIVRGVVEIGAAIRLRRLIEHEWLLGLAGVVSIAFGVLLLMRPGIGMLALLWWFGIWAMVFGVVAIAQSLRLLSVKNRLEGRGGETPPLRVA
ncbi:MAG: HdeD family acid-resistance protein [Polyangiaceae bacterium]